MANGTPNKRSIKKPANRVTSLAVPPLISRTKRYQKALQEAGVENKESVAKKMWTIDWADSITDLFLEVRNLNGKNDWIIANRATTTEQLYETVGSLNSFLMVFRGTTEANTVEQILISVEAKVAEEWNKDRKREEKFQKVRSGAQ